MSTPAQVIANRENSKLSTGPNTEKGKEASSHNHLVHGLCAAGPVLPTEDRNQFNALLDRYKSENAPSTAHQEFLVQQMTGARWKLNRIERLENEMFAALDSPEKAFTDDETAKRFARLERYRAALERTYNRCARELRADRKEQFEAKSRQPLGNYPPEFWQRMAEVSRIKANWKFRGDNFLKSRPQTGDGNVS